jgi:hypothetical protein
VIPENARRSSRFEIVLGGVLLALFLGFGLWQSPSLWRGPLTPTELDHLVAELEAHIALAPDEKAAFIARLREWGSMDDGRPVLLLNLTRYREQLGALPPGSDFEGTPLEANAHYERQVAPLALRRGEYPLIGGDAQTHSLTPGGAATDRWDRVVVMRAPSRRAFLRFMADPAYGPAVAYKLAATEVVLIPLHAELTIPDLRWLVGGLLLTVYLSVCWRRAARSPRSPSSHPPAATGSQ